MRGEKLNMSREGLQEGRRVSGIKHSQKPRHDRRQARRGKNKVSNILHIFLFMPQRNEGKTLHKTHMMCFPRNSFFQIFSLLRSACVLTQRAHLSQAWKNTSTKYGDAPLLKEKMTREYGFITATEAASGG